MEDSGIVLNVKDQQQQHGDEEGGLNADLSKMHLFDGGEVGEGGESGSGTNSLSSDDSGIGLISPPRTPPSSSLQQQQQPQQQQAFLSSSPSRAVASSNVTYSPYVNGSILSVPKSWNVTDNGENLVVSVYAFVKSFLGYVS